MSFHSLSFRTFCQETEDEAKVVQALRFASGVDEINRSISEGYHGNKIVVLECTLKSKRNIDEFFGRLGKEDLVGVLETIESRVDDDCNLFFRLDKQEAYLGQLVVSQTEDVISVRAKIECYPKKRSLALERARSCFASLAGAKEQSSIRG